jgi:hypothetical protein
MPISLKLRAQSLTVGDSSQSCVFVIIQRRSSRSFSFTNPSRPSSQRIKVIFDDDAGLHRRNPIAQKDT